MSLEPVLKLREVLRRGILTAAKAAQPAHLRRGLQMRISYKCYAIFGTTKG